ncbi:hypothetical protein CJU90_4094 [Yarrowia sp. C11]|nr:hypothetical protein CKK34_5703 [Yarrowia sp. E02]KAG5367787.1 hypothetical protein CJU90_4094 [Yarrowia sp. C11]
MQHLVALSFRNVSLYQRWMQIPPSQRIVAAAFTGILAYGGMKVTDYFNEQGDIDREAAALLLKEHQQLNQAADKERRKE